MNNIQKSIFVFSIPCCIFTGWLSVQIGLVIVDYKRDKPEASLVERAVVALERLADAEERQVGK